MAFVIDASAHCPLEIANGLVMALRRGCVTAEQAQEFIKDLAPLSIPFESAIGPAECWRSFGWRSNRPPAARA
jgi:hypothetical protein